MPHRPSRAGVQQESRSRALSVRSPSLRGVRAQPINSSPLQAILLFLCALGLGFAVANLLTGEDRAFHASVGFFISAMPFAAVTVHNERRILHPLSLIGFLLIIGVGLQSAYLGYWASPAAESFLLPTVPREALAGGYLITAVGILSLVVGFYARPNTHPHSRVLRAMRKLERRRLGDIDLRRFLLVGTGLLAIASVAFLDFIRRFGVQSLDDLAVSQKRFFELESGVRTILGYHRLFMSLASVVFVLGVFVIAKYRVRLASPIGLLTGLSFVLAALVAVFTSSRSDVLAPIVIACIVFTGLRGVNVRAGLMFRLAFVLFPILILLGAVRFVNQGGAGESLGDALGSERVATFTYGSRKFMSVASTATVVARVPEVYPYQYGRTLVAALWAPIPRSVWEEKPPVRIGPEIGPPVYGLHPRRNTGVPPGVIGELYINFSWVGVPIGMALFGRLLRHVDGWRLETAQAKGVTALVYAYAMVSLAVRLPPSDVTGILSDLLTSLAWTACVLAFVRPTRSASRRRNGSAVRLSRSRVVAGRVG